MTILACWGLPPFTVALMLKLACAILVSDRVIVILRIGDLLNFSFFFVRSLSAYFPVKVHCVGKRPF